MKKYTATFCFLFLFGTLFAQRSEQKIIASDNGAGDFFGRYLCLKNGTMMIAAHQDDENGYASGSLYIFEQTDGIGPFIEKQKLLPEDGDIEEFFGYSIDIENDWAITGSHHDSDFGGSSGSAFVLHKTNGIWDFYQKLVPEDARAGDEFGKAVGFFQNKIALGAFLDDDQFSNSGSLYIFSYDNGEYKQDIEIYPDDPEAYDQFGNFLSYADSLIIVGVPEKKNKGTQSGCSYIFEEKSDSFIQVAKLLPEDIGPGDHFGQAVDISKDLCVVGAYKSDFNKIDGGAAYIYLKQDNDWILHQRLIPADNEEGDHFGSAVSLYQNYLAVGAYFDDDNGKKSGSVYLYKWVEGEYKYLSKIIASDGSQGDAFGAALDLDEQRLLVGAYADSENGFFSGTAYLYDLSDIMNIRKISKKENIIIYPQPSRNELNISLNQEPGSNAKLYLFDLNGNCHFNSGINDQYIHLDLSALNTGIYILNIRDRTNIYYKKIIKL